MTTIYQQLQTAGVPTDHHESDLYCKVTPESTALLVAIHDPGVSTFRDRVTGDQWYDIPFAFDPFCEAK